MQPLKNKFYLNVRFGKLCDKLGILCFTGEDYKEFYISSFLNNTGSFRGLGIGAAVMIFLKSVAVKLKTDITLNASDDAINFYLKEGFQLENQHGDGMVWRWNREKLEQDSKKSFNSPLPSVRSL
jgi:GNAT superfamily N-acetyltransferase